jgi:hypothetical protein
MPFHASTVHVGTKAKPKKPTDNPERFSTTKAGKRLSRSEEKRMKQGKRKGKPSQALRGGAGGLGRISDALK